MPNFYARFAYNNEAITFEVDNAQSREEAVARMKRFLAILFRSFPTNLIMQGNIQILEQPEVFTTQELTASQQPVTWHARNLADIYFPNGVPTLTNIHGVHPGNMIIVSGADEWDGFWVMIDIYGTLVRFTGNAVQQDSSYITFQADGYSDTVTENNISQESVAHEYIPSGIQVDHNS